MRKVIVQAIAACLLVLAAPARAQTTVVTQSSISFGETAFAETVIKEKRRDGKVESAELDMCFQSERDGPWDRAVINLKPADGELSGSGVSQLKKTPVTFSYAHKLKGNDLNYSGTLKIGGVNAAFSIDHVSESTEKEYEESLHQIPLVEKPANFYAVSPQWVAVRVKLGGMPVLIDFLRKQDVMLDVLFGLSVDCAALRAGSQTIQFVVNPARAEAVIAEAKKVSGVIAAGWGNYSNMSAALRLPATQWTVGGKPDRKKLESEIGKSLARALQASMVSSSWNSATGELVLGFERKSQHFPGLGFTDNIEVALLAEFERPGTADYILVGINEVKALLADKGAGARLKIRPMQEFGGGGLYVDSDPLVQALSRDLNAPAWDTLEEKWRR